MALNKWEVGKKLSFIIAKFARSPSILLQYHLCDDESDQGQTNKSRAECTALKKFEVQTYLPT